MELKMWQFVAFLALVFTTNAIRVPVDSNEQTSTPTPQSESEESDEGPVPVDSYLIPPNPYMNDDPPPGNLVPATYLVPPSLNQRNYFSVEAPSSNLNWQPVRPHLPINILAQKPIPYSQPLIYKDSPDSESEEVHIEFQPPSRQLEPPFETPSKLFSNEGNTEKKSSKIRTPASDLQLPNADVKNTFNPTASAEEEETAGLSSAEPTLALHLTPPKYGPVNSNIPTKLYPKKYGQSFRPVPIPIYQFADANPGIPIARPLKVFTPVDSEEVEQIPYNEKLLFLQQQAEEKRRLKEQDEYRKQQELDAAVEQTYGKSPQDADASETSYGPHGPDHEVGQPLSSGAPSDAQLPPVPPPGERTEFRMHGLNGPHSYQFGYDTGKGKNRQFRYEERDNDGRVKGHYGYMDGDGKMRVVNYGADPETGFHADPAKESP